MSIKINKAAKEAVTALFSIITLEDIQGYLAHNAPTLELAEITYGFLRERRDEADMLIETDKFEAGAEMQVIGFRTIYDNSQDYQQARTDLRKIVQDGIIIVTFLDKVRILNGGNAYLSEKLTKSLIEKLKNLLK